LQLQLQGAVPTTFGDKSCPNEQNYVAGLKPKQESPAQLQCRSVAAAAAAPLQLTAAVLIAYLRST
jgi:hypothetical protein